MRKAGTTPAFQRDPHLRHELPRKASVSDDTDEGSTGERRVSAAHLAAAQAGTDRYIFDAGASRHALNPAISTEQEREHIKPLQQPVTLDTANGQIFIDLCTEIK